eukprot:5080993-Pyramimonas_sp.AAC.1
MARCAVGFNPPHSGGKPCRRRNRRDRPRDTKSIIQGKLIVLSLQSRCKTLVSVLKLGKVSSQGLGPLQPGGDD